MGLSGERGLKDLDAPPLARGRVRREGGGRDASLLDGLKRLVETATLGDPMRWGQFSLDFFSPEQISGKVCHLTERVYNYPKSSVPFFQSLGMPCSLLISAKRHRGVNLLSVLSWIAVPTAGGA